MTDIQATAARPIFARHATGLVRELSAWHVLVFNASWTNIGLILVFMFLFVPSFHPGADMLLAVVLGIVAAVPMAFTNAMLASTFPRSGGEYVYNSRVISPSVGFATNFNMTVWLLFYIGVACVLFPRYGLTALFRFIGVQWESSAFLDAASWVATPTGAFIIGTLVLIALVCGYILSTRRMAQFLSWCFVLGLIGVGLAVAVLLTLDRADYVERFGTYFTKIAGDAGTLPSLLDDAEKNGYATADFSFFETMVVFYWPANFLLLCNASIYFGGEVRSAKCQRRSKSTPLAGVKMHHLMRFSPALAVVPVVHRRDPRCFV